MALEDSPEKEEIFRSDVLDLSGVDLTGLSELPSDVLRAAIQRVCAELSSDCETAAYFQSSLRAIPREQRENRNRLD